MLRTIGILSKLRFFLNSSTLLLLHNSFVHSHLIFGIHLWGSTSQSHLSKLQNLQNKAIRIITNIKRKSPITPQFYKLRILKIKDLHAYEIAKIMHQHNQITPACFSAFFTNLSSIHGRKTRPITNKNLCLHKYFTSRCQVSIKFQGPKIWNSIPVNLRKMTFPNFKKT